MSIMQEGYMQLAKKNSRIIEEAISYVQLRALYESERKNGELNFERKRQINKKYDDLKAAVEALMTDKPLPTFEEMEQLAREKLKDEMRDQ
jgi:hypothetical protein